MSKPPVPSYYSEESLRRLRNHPHRPLKENHLIFIDAKKSYTLFTEENPQDPRNSTKYSVDKENTNIISDKEIKRQKIYETVRKFSRRLGR